MLWCNFIARPRMTCGADYRSFSRRPASVWAWIGSGRRLQDDRLGSRGVDGAPTRLTHPLGAAIVRASNRTICWIPGRANVQERLGRIAATVEGGGRISRDDAAVLWEHAGDDELKRL